MEKEFGWAVLGCGVIAERVWRELKKKGGHKLITVWSRTSSRADAFANQFGGQSCESLQSAVTHAGVEGVYIATPHSVHYEQALECLKLNIPVLVEKPATVNAEQFEHLMRVSAKSKVYLAEGMWTRFHFLTKNIQERVIAGEIGEIVSFQAGISYPGHLSGFSKRIWLPEYAGGALLDVGVYAIAYAHMLLGKPSTMSVVSRFSKEGVDVRDRITLQYEGKRAELFCSITGMPWCHAVIEGTKGRISIPMFFKPTVASISGENKKRLHGGRGFIYEFDEVAEEIRGGCTGSNTVQQKDTLEVLKTMDALRKEMGLKYPDKLEQVQNEWNL